MIDVLRAVQRCYDEVADTYADHFPSTEPEQPVDLAMIAHFAALLGEGRRVLDAGCGAGRMMPLLAGLGCEVRGVDLSPGMVRRGRVDHPEFDIEVASLIDLPFGDGEVDGVFAWYSTIHTPDAGLPGVLAELGRVLRHDGLLLLAFQTGHGVREVGLAFASGVMTCSSTATTEARPTSPGCWGTGTSGWWRRSTGVPSAPRRTGRPW